MDDQKEEIENLRKQIKGLKISLMLTQISTVVFTIILGCQCLRSIQNYHYLLQQVSIQSNIPPDKELNPEDKPEKTKETTDVNE